MKKMVAKLMSFLLMVGLFLPITSLFVRDTKLKLLFSVAAGVLLAPVLTRLLEAFEVRRARRHFQQFLQNMASRLNGGQAFRFSLEGCLSQMQEQAGGTRFASQLRLVRKAIDLQAPYRDLIPLLREAFACPEAPPFFALLMHPEKLGDKLSILFRYYEQNIRESQNQRESQEAEQARSLTESLSLAVMPILMLWFLTRTASDYMTLAYVSTGGRVMLGLAFLLFLLSCFFLYRIFLPGQEKPLKAYSMKKQTHKQPQRIRLRYTRLTPAFLQERHKEAILVLLPLQAEATELDFQSKLLRDHFRFLVYGIVFMALGLRLTDPSWFLLVLPLLLLIYPDYRLINDASEWRFRVQKVLPDLFTYLLICLRSGHGVGRSFQMAESSFASSQVLAVEVKGINQQLVNRKPLQEILDDFIRRLGLPEASMFVRLLAQYGAGGDSTDLELMELQVQQLRHVLKEKKRKKEARQANRYLLPMVLDLVAVMLISLAPVIPSFQF